MFNRRLESFVPTIYKGIVEMEDIMATEEEILDTSRYEMMTAFANTFVVTADINGIIIFEQMLGIVANPLIEDLEFRRQRILNRLSMTPPFTFRFLKQRLDEIIGVDAWSAHIDFDNYTLYIESSALDQNWYSELAFTINRIKPCNMIFTNVPYTTRSIKVSEEISYETLVWKYRLGSWLLAQHPFSKREEGGLVKMPEMKSVQDALLNDTAEFVADDIASVLINDSIAITNFETKSVIGNQLTMEYEVTPLMTSLITNIKLLRADNEILTESDVYVPVSETVLSKHIIRVKEGA